MHRIASIIFLALSTSAVSAQRLAPPPVNPKDYASPSNTFAVRIDPSDLYGRGEAEYQVTRKGAVVWSGKRSFTLYEAGITDDGIIAGYAYTYGLEGFSEQGRRAGAGEFHVVIMRSTGELLLDEVVKRTGSRFLHALPNPLADGILLDQTNNQLIVLVHDPDLNRQQHSWWTYRLSDGKLVGKFSSGPPVPSADAAEEPADSTSKPPDLSAFQEKPLKLLGTLPLRNDANTNQAVIRDIWDYDLDDRGNIGFIRREENNRYSAVLVTAEGKVLRETRLVGLEKLGFNAPNLAWLEKDRWIIAFLDSADRKRSLCAWWNASNGEVIRAAGFSCPSIDALTGTRDGGFVALTTTRYQYSMEDSLISFDRDGKRRWEIKEDSSGGTSALFSPEDVTVTTGGRIAVLDSIRNSAQFFSSNGNYLATFDLKKSWDREPRYPSEISADKDDGVLIRDFHGNPPVVRMDAKGKVTAQFELKHPDGRVIDPRHGIRVSPSGHVWASDGECFIRIRNDGVSDLALGKAPSNESLTTIAAVAMDQSGHLYAVDERTGAVHVFDTNGSVLRVCKPNVTDFKNQLIMPIITAAPDGTVFVSDTMPGEKTYLQFAPDGKRSGTKRFDLDNITEVWLALPKGDRLLVLGYHEAFLVDGQGNVLRKIQRRPDRNWLEYARGGSVAPDGSFAIQTDGEKNKWQVNLYAPSGDPVRTVEMPPACIRYYFAYTGKHLVTRTETEICLLRSTGEPLLKFTPTGVSPEEYLHLCATFEGRELWLVNATQKKVWRYELPASTD